MARPQSPPLHCGQSEGVVFKSPFPVIYLALTFFKIWFCFWTTPVSTQGLLWLCAGEMGRVATPGGAEGTRRSLNQTWGNHRQSLCFSLLS